MINKYLLLKPVSLWYFCYSSWSRLGQEVFTLNILYVIISFLSLLTFVYSIRPEIFSLPYTFLYPFCYIGSRDAAYALLSVCTEPITSVFHPTLIVSLFVQTLAPKAEIILIYHCVKTCETMDMKEYKILLKCVWQDITITNVSLHHTYYLL